MNLRRLLVGTRRFRPERVVGAGTVARVVAWSIIAVVALTVHRSPALLDGPLSVSAVLAAVPVGLVPLAVGGVAAVVVLVSLLRELRYVLFGRRSGRGPHDSSPLDGSEEGGLFDTLGDFGDFGDFGGDDE